MTKPPVNVVKGEKGFQPTSRGAAPPTAATPTIPPRAKKETPDTVNNMSTAFQTIMNKNSEQPALPLTIVAALEEHDYVVKKLSNSTTQYNFSFVPKMLEDDDVDGDTNPVSFRQHVARRAITSYTLTLEVEEDADGALVYQLSEAGFVENSDPAYREGFESLLFRTTSATDVASGLAEILPNPRPVLSEPSTVEQDFENDPWAVASQGFFPKNAPPPPF